FLTHFNVGNGTIDKLDIKMGDVNDDFSVDITDVTDVMKNIAGIDKFDSLQRFLSDVNLDGIADVKDATEIQRWICR
ncbi:MAG: dockerin type I domain-containing protein, partial [Clostridiales bacterium]|nr:dockerin type I domain-containing protein [Clostridiales bacterium]